MSTNSRGVYPPQGHIIRHLGMDLELISEDELSGVMPILDDLRDGGGALRTGALATLVDVAAGTYSHEMVRPDWLATTDMKLHLRRPCFGGEVRTVTTTVRAGKRNILSSTMVSDDEGEAARAWVTYARLPRRDDSPPVDGSRLGLRLHYVEKDEGDRPMLDDYLGLRPLPDELAIELDHHPRIHNSFGSLQGGAAAVVIESAAAMAAERELGVPCRTTDLHVQYLSQSRSGPFRVEAVPLRVTPTAVTSEIVVLDAGNDRHLLDLATATAVPLSVDA